MQTTFATEDMSKVTHIHWRLHRSRDPDLRPEAESYCGEFVEASWSGKSGMVRGTHGATCERCVHIYEAETAAMRKEIDSL